MLATWGQERRLMVSIVIFAVVVGWLTQHWLLSLLLAALIYLFWHLRQYYFLFRWLSRGAKPGKAPDLSGIWEPAVYFIYNIQRRNQKRKARLKALLARSEKIATSLPDGTVVLRANNEIDWANKTATALLGVKYPGDVGQRIDNLIRTPLFRRYLESERYDEDTLEIISPINDTIELNIRIIPFGTKERLLIARDVSSFNRVQAMRRDFVANVSHELRTPLTVMNGYLETLLDDETFSNRAILMSIQHQSFRMQSIVESLLELSRLESDPKILSDTEVPVSPMLSALVNDARHLADKSGHILQLEADDSVSLQSREKELNSLLSNLMHNAMQHTPSGSTILLRWFLDKQQRAVFQVVDDGPGIEEEHLARLTERFYRVDSGRSRDKGGSGLGLSIVKHIMLRHEGSLEIKSEVGKGTSFTCIFPKERTMIYNSKAG